MDMASADNSNWLMDFNIMEAISVPGHDFAAPATGFCWPSQPVIAFPNASVKVDCSFGESNSLREVDSHKRVEVEYSFGDSDSHKEVGSQKRAEVDCSYGESDSSKEVGSTRKRSRCESSGGSCSKACREKLRRDRLNERFLELVAAMEPGRLLKTDKAAILSDAVRILTQLRSDSIMLKETIEDLQAKIKELKVEKNELRDERQRLKEDNDRLVLQVRAMTAQNSFLTHSSAMSTALTPQGQATSNRLPPFISYPGLTMWQMIPSTTLDTSQDHVLHPPVA